MLLRNFQTRQGGTWLLALTYLLLGTILRLGFLLASAREVSWGLPTFAALLIGCLYDVVMAWFLTLPFAGLSLIGGAAWRRWVRECRARQSAARAQCRATDHPPTRNP